MAISGLVIAALVEISAVFWGTQFLERELRRHSAKAEERHAELVGKADALSSMLNELRRDLTGMEDRRKKDATALEAQRKKDMETLLTEQGTTAGAFRMVFEKMNEMPSRQDLAEAFKQLEELPDIARRDQEGAMSKAMEEGISSILGYTAGKAPGVEFRL